MSEVTKAFDEILKRRQAKCDHNYQDRRTVLGITSCAACGKVEQ